MNKVLVYGTLKKGFGNHRLIERAYGILQYKGVVRLPFKMVSLGGFPALIPTTEVHEIECEIYEVDDECFASLDRLEGYPNFYEREWVRTPVGYSWVYFLPDERDHAPEVNKTEGVFNWTKGGSNE